jgi:alpha-beta hydrolase superfamily lysophospholipase
VGVFDLPGHGLSGGETVRMDSMEEYTQAFNDFTDIMQQRTNAEVHAVGFSTGAAILIDLLLTGRADKLDKIVLAAPLIRWTLYEQSKGTYKVYSRFTDKISRFYRKNSSDPEFLAFNKTQDYLHARHLSLHWIKAMFDWNEKVEALPPVDKKALILQGDKDTTIDWRYNLDLQAKKLPSAQVIKIPGARHEIFNEAEKFRISALKSIIQFLEKRP